MKSIDEQFPLLQVPPSSPPAWNLEYQSTEAAAFPAATQVELPLTKPQPAKDLASWLARLSPAARRKALSRRQGPAAGMDPVTGLPF